MLRLARPACTLLALCCACGASSPPVEEAPPRESQEPQVIDRPLAALLPDMPRSVVIARPDELARAPAVLEWARLLLTDEALVAIETRTGIRPAEVTELVRADYGADRVVWLVRGAGPVRDLVRAAEMRMTTVDERGDEPFRRTGHIGARRRAWVALADDTLLVAGGHAETEVAAIVRAARLAHRPAHEVSDPVRADWVVDGLPAPETGGHFLANTLALHAESRRAPLLVLVGDPLGLPVDTGIGMLLARQEQLAATLEPRDGALRVELTLTGEFPPGAEANFRQLFEGVAGSDLGRAMALSEARESFELEVEEGTVHAALDWPSAGLARGVELLGGSDPWILIEGE